jgi:DNA ligase (NAD+)
MYTPEAQRALFDLSKSLLFSPQADLFSDAAAERAENLRSVIRYHEWRYYVQNDPVISDFEYDQLYKQLEALERLHPELITPDSPTQRVSTDLTEDLDQVAHLTAMLSLDNSYDAADLNDFDTSVKKLCGLPKDGDVEYAVEPKFDGGTIALVYENDRLCRAATRGNGEVGDEITANMRTLRSIPLQAGFSRYGIAKAELRGEAIIRKDVFEKINAAGRSRRRNAFCQPPQRRHRRPAHERPQRSRRPRPRSVHLPTWATPWMRRGTHAGQISRAITRIRCGCWKGWGSRCRRV